MVLGNKNVGDDVLHTALTEVEYALNSRPLTYVSGTADEPEAITPNHFLLKSGSHGLPHRGGGDRRDASPNQKIVGHHVLYPPYNDGSEVAVIIPALN